MLLVIEIFAFIVTLLSALYPARRVISPLVFEARVINTLWNIRTEALMLEEYLSTVTVSSLTGEVKDVDVNEVVGLASDDETEVVENASDDCCFHGVNPFFPWRSSLGVMPYALGVTISAGTVLCVSHPGLEPAMAALRWHG